MSRIDKSMQTEYRLMVSRGWRKKGSGEKLVNEVGVSLWSDRNILEQWLHSIVNAPKATKVFTLKWVILCMCRPWGR